MATAQIAHVAARAGYHPNFPEITDETYIIVLVAPEPVDIYADRLTHWCHPDYAIGDEREEDLIAFHEPDLDDQMTAIAVLNPAPGLFNKLQLFGKEVK